MDPAITVSSTVRMYLKHVPYLPRQPHAATTRKVQWLDPVEWTLVRAPTSHRQSSVSGTARYEG